MRDETVARIRAPREVLPGSVDVEPLPGAWLHVQVHRGERVKRFNLRHEEARQLIEALREYVLT